MSKVFTYEENGLSYTVTVYEENGQVFADITVTSGFMDVNAVYIADDNFSGDSASLGGPLNMNGGGSTYEGETVQWDDAIALSRPGLGREGTDKETYLGEGDMLTVPLNVSSIDDVDFVGIRATSTSTPEGSIKGVSGDPTEEDDNGDDDNGDDDITYSKVFFAVNVNEDGLPVGGDAITLEELQEEDPDATGTFQEYLDAFLGVEFQFAIEDLQAVVFYDGEDLEEVFRLEGPFEDADDLLAAYDAAIEAMGDDMDTSSLFIAMDLDEMESHDEPDEEEAELEVI